MAHAVVIGGGFGGMAAALRLRAKGYEVTVIEKQKQLGGRAMVMKRDGFTFDMGPTVITAPFLFDELFELFGKKREDYVKFVPIYPWYRVVFHDGTHFDYGGTIEQTLEQIRKFEPGDCDGYVRFLEHSRRIFDVGFTQLGDQPFLTVWSMLRQAPTMMKLGSHRSVWKLACKYIKNDKLRRVFSFQPLLVGGNPFNTTSIYCLIHYLEREYGVHFALGGTGAIVEALQRLSKEVGIEVILDTEMAELEIHPTRVEAKEMYDAIISQGSKPRIPPPAARGVQLNGGKVLAADVVVCNADAPYLHKQSIDDEFRHKWTDGRLDKLKYSMSLFVLYFGTTRKYPDVRHHTILLGEKYESLLHEMFDLKKLEMSDFSVYLHRPTATDPSMAPEGCDCFYCLVPVPNLQSNIDWQTMGPKYRDLVVEWLERKILPGLKQCITSESYVTPLFYRDELNTLHGTGFSIQPTFWQSAYFRFHNKSEDIENLYFVGAGTHPGAGMPGVLCSAKVLDRLVPPVPRTAHP
jgi:phytoene desaturase